MLESVQETKSYKGKQAGVNVKQAILGLANEHASFRVESNPKSIRLSRRKTEAVLGHLIFTSPSPANLEVSKQNG